MEWKLELVVVPVTDVDRAKTFYTDKLRFNLDHDTRVSDEMRVLQLTPPGSACSIALGTGIVDTPPGLAQGMQLVVSDIEAARAELVERGVEVSQIQRFENGAWVDGRGGDWNSFVFFRDPDEPLGRARESRSRLTPRRRGRGSRGRFARTGLCYSAPHVGGGIAFRARK